ncbi:AAA family ATPase [Faecalicoccus pleomorphus]|uniref:AAA family ATPase n=1 Tax=Faecalicoccus pleomorphus TaxID=1323 RepID=UPI0025A44FBC|nr:AAA family ATPase [Faecalicoccus pleomorphus]MDM8292059.1 AAA family ATPase [Faecalicoccus pleomorphus]
MFEYVKLKNFKSFDDVELNLLDRRNNPKKLILIYGENGIGKSNIASAFFMLAESIRTMNVRDIMESLLSENSHDLNNNEKLKKYLRMRYKDTETLIKENKLVSSDGPMYMEFGFNIEGKKGKYIFETNNYQIIRERLEFTLIKRRGVCFDISENNFFLSDKLFSNKEAYSTIKDACLKFWGKHSMLSIIFHEVSDKSDQYIHDQISNNFNDFLSFISRISCKITFGGGREKGIIGLPREILGEYDQGTIPAKNEKILDKAEKMLTNLFKLTNRNIKKAYYKRTEIDDEIHYELMLSEQIAGRIRDISFALESTGTQSITQQLPFMLVAAKGSTAIIDEFDTGIHDLLVKGLVTSLYKSIEGQLILTTHNTLLMESNLPKDSIYIINESSVGKKEIQCILYYNNKIGGNNNIRNQYLLGKYRGIPSEININFHELLQIINKSNI